MTRPRLVRIQRDNTRFCEDESNFIFDDVASAANGDPDIIEGSDIHAVIELFQALTGLSWSFIFTIYNFDKLFPLWQQ